MGKTRKKPPAERDPTEAPVYTVWDVARYLGLPVWTVPAMAGQGPPDPEWFFHHLHHRWRHYPLNDEFSPDDQPRLSFRRLADLFVRGFAIQAVHEAARDAGRKPDRWERVYERTSRTLDLRAGDPDVFGGGEDAVDRLVERHASHSPGADADRLRKLLLLRLERVEMGEGGPQRLFPFTRDPAEGSPRVVVLDPRVRFGRPTLSGRGVPTDVVIERFRAGDSPVELAADYDLPLAEVEEAIRYETLYPNTFPFFPFIGW